MNLFVHCGVREARVGAQDFIADPVLDDGWGNPPRSWQRIAQPGTMTVYDDGSALFDDGAGHVAWFRPRTAADPGRICA